MSLLDICVIFAYYSHASVNKSTNKITNQKFDNDYVLSKIKEIEEYHSSGLQRILWSFQERNQKKLKTENIKLYNQKKT
jgi:hypothetical protein